MFAVQAQGYLACRLIHAEMMLDSAQVQKGLYKQLLADKSQEAKCLRYESKMLKLEHKCAEDRLVELRSQLKEAQHELHALHMDAASS